MRLRNDLEESWRIALDGLRANKRAVRSPRWAS
jgi:hypothetical protein